MANLYVWVEESRQEALLGRIRKLHKVAGYFRDLPADMDPIAYLIHALFPDGQPCQFHAANVSLSAGEDGRTKLALRPAIDPLGEFRFPRGSSLVLTGSWARSVPQPIFMISDIGEISDSPTREFERLLDVFVYHHDPQQRLRREDNVLLSENVTALPLISRITQERLQDWDEFVRWKRKLVQASAVGIRYSSRSWLDAKTLAFDLVAPDRAALQQAQRALGRDELRAFALDASDDPLTFRPLEAQRKPRPREFALGKALPGTLDVTEIDSGTGFPDRWIRASWSVAPDDDALNAIDAAEDSETVRQRLIDRIPEEGFLSMSMAGDLSLLRRHEQAIRKLKEQGGSSPYLSTYLFDVKQARSPQEITPVRCWHQPSLNDPQRKAVEKMLAAPDLCLLQGPPGTGKTTVIAEAMLQMVARGETVLLTSQAHTAVDNALDRLGHSTAVRAIRLGREDKVTDEGRAFYGARSLQRHYEALADHSARQLNAWTAEALACDRLASWCDRARFALADAQSLQSQLQLQRKELVSLEHASVQAWKSLQQAAQEREDHAAKQRSLAQWRQALATPQVGDLPPRWPAEMNAAIDELAASIFALAEQAVPLRASTTEWKSRPGQMVPMLALLLDDMRLADKASHQARADAERLLALPAGQHQDPAVRLQIERLKQDEETSLAFMEAEPDEERHAAAWRAARASKRLLEQAHTAAFDEAACARLFRDPSPWRQPAADTAAQAQRMLDALQPIDAGLARARLAKQLALEKVEDAIASASSVSELDEGPWRQAQAELDRQRMVIGKAEATLAQKVTQIEAVRMAYPALQEPGARDVNAPCATDGETAESSVSALHTTLEAARIALAEAQSHSQANLEHRSLWGPLLNEWVRDLRSADTAEVDWKHLGPGWPAMCNVVAITCNERDSTLDDAGHAQFDVVIIDEVSKATPLEMLLPLMRSRRAVLVGDHRQLPPLFQESLDAVTVQDVAEEARADDPAGAAATALSEENLRRFERMVTASLFKEHFEAANEAIRGRLSVQFRMHPQIMSLVNRFYEGSLTCGLDHPDKDRAHPFVLPDINGNPMLTADDHVLWIDTSRGLDGQICTEDLDSQGKPRRTNLLEARLIAHLMLQLDHQAVVAGHSPHRRMSVGVVSFYAAQLRMIRTELDRVKPRGGWQALDVDVNTVIRYQGREKDVVLVSLVRNDGRLDEPGRPKRRRSSRANVARYEFINVALSRARNLLIALGARSMFESYEVDLPNMDKSGSTRRPVYSEMFKQLELEGRLFEARKVLAADRPAGGRPTKPGGRSAGAWGLQ